MSNFYKKAHFFLFLLFVCGELIASGIGEFFLPQDTILGNHNLLKQTVDECYQTIGDNYKKHFNPGGNWKGNDGFVFQKSINFCAIGFQFIYKNNGQIKSSDFNILKDPEGKVLIASNTSVYQWVNSVKSFDKFHLLAWPYKKKHGNFYDYNQMLVEIQLKLPTTIKESNLPGYKPITTKFILKIYNSIFFLGAIIDHKIKFSDLKNNDIEEIKFSEAVFNKSFLYINEKTKKTTWHTNHNRINSIKIFLQNNNFINNQGLFEFNKTNFYKLKIHEEYIIDNIDNDKEKEKKEDFLEYDVESILDLYAYCLGVDKKTYQSLTNTDNNPLAMSKKEYPCYFEDDIDIFHSEPLFSWLLNQDFLIRQTMQEVGINEEQKLFTLCYLYTERQTCPSCEYLLQKQAYDRYIPLIAFKDTFDPNFILKGGFRLPFFRGNSKDRIKYPYTLSISLPEKFSQKHFEVISTYEYPVDSESLVFHEKNKIYLINKIERKKIALEQNEKNLQMFSDFFHQTNNSQQFSDSYSFILALFELEIKNKEQIIEIKKKQLENYRNDLESEEIIIYLLKNMARLPLQYKL